MSTIHSFLNPHLIVKQGLNEDEVRLLEELHEKRLNLFKLMASCDPKMKGDRVMLAEYAQQVEQLEFRMQEAWKFDKDRNMHSWWFRVPHCRCPKLDNEEHIGTPYRIFTQDCPVHGELHINNSLTLWERIKRIFS